MPSIVDKKLSIANQIFQDRWPGYKPVSQHFEQGYRIIELEPVIKEGICPHCASKCYKVHSRSQRQAIEAPINPFEPLKLIISVIRFRCSCGRTFVMKSSFIEPKAKVTNAMILFVQQLLRVPSLSLSDVSRLTGLSVTSIKMYDKNQLRYCYDNIDLKGVENLAIDEFSLHKGRKYATVIIDNDNCKVLWVCKGKSQKSVQPFFDLLKERGFAGNIRSVACDQNAAYPRLVRENLPNATIIYDLFHVMAHWHKDVLAEAKKATQERAIKRIREQEERQAKDHSREVDKGAINAAISALKRQLTNADWLLVSRLDALKPEKAKRKQEQLDNLLHDNELLASLYPVAESLRKLWQEKNLKQAEACLKELRQLLLEISHKYDFKPAKNFALMLARRMDGILNAGRFGFTTNRLEGVNNKIKVLKRIAFGFRDDEYFFLKIKGALPGKYAVPIYKKLSGFAVLGQRIWQGPWNPAQVNPCNGFSCFTN